MRVRAFIKDHLGRFRRCKKGFIREALELDPEDAISHNNLGLVLGKMGKP